MRVRCIYTNGDFRRLTQKQKSLAFHQMGIISNTINFAVRLMVGLFLCALIGVPASISSVEIYTSFLSYYHNSRADLLSGYLSIAIVGLIAGLSFTFVFGAIRSVHFRLAVGALGGVVFGLIHALLWGSHNYAAFLGYWSFFVPYSVAWGSVCGLAYSSLCFPILNKLSIGRFSQKLASKGHLSLVISSSVAVVCAFIPLIYQFFSEPRSESEAVVVIASFEACPGEIDFATLHNLSIPETHEGLVLTINQNVAAVIGPYNYGMAQRLRTFHNRLGNFSEEPFILDVNDVLDWAPCS